MGASPTILEPRVPASAVPLEIPAEGPRAHIEQGGRYAPGQRTGEDVFYSLFLSAS